jgi:hypothetical protein
VSGPAAPLDPARGAAGRTIQGMADTPAAQPPAAQPPAAPAAQPPGQEEPERPERNPWDTVGTVLMVGAVAFAAIILLDLMAHGRILGPVIARFVKTPPPVEQEQPAGDA